MLVSESIGRASHADMDPLEISILATRDRDSDIFSPGVPNIGTLFLKEELMDRCHAPSTTSPSGRRLRTTSSASSTSPSSNSRPSVPRCSGLGGLQLRGVRRLGEPYPDGDAKPGHARPDCVDRGLPEQWEGGPGSAGDLPVLECRAGGSVAAVSRHTVRAGLSDAAQKSELGELARLFAAEVRTALRLETCCNRKSIGKTPNSTP